ncbi:MAG TPA: glycerophosphodiester phosphodiesterase family protein [Chloroflexota bacterium]|nr:glycerophosphodiester phosphodiesterase family protein [Chloroflexota bacterium]
MRGLGVTRINLHGRAALREHLPLLVAHRGAVSPGIPENTVVALRAAAAEGYALVEIDVEVTADGVPVLFHPDRAGTMWVSCGVERSIRHLTLPELSAVQYRASDHGIPTLDEALAVCAHEGLGVVLDLKVNPAPPAYLEKIARLLDWYGLAHSTLLLSEDPAAEAVLAHRVVPIVSRALFERVVAGEAVSLRGQFRPAFADRLRADEVAALQRNGALVLATVAPRLYPPHAHRALAHSDISRLRDTGVDAFLIDHEYRDLFLERGPNPDLHTNADSDHRP